MTKYKNWQILLWLFLWSTISIMCAQLPIWGSIAAIVAASVTVISAIILGGKSIRNWQINRKPFINIKCWWQLFDANNPKHSDLEYGTNDLFISFTKGKPNYSDKITATVGKYHIYLELTPQLPLDAAEINLRFLDSGVGIPHLIGFYDANRRPSQEYRTEYF